ncbi:LexA family protein [Pseudomonas aeruginosa]|uniref:LexA family protein n=1 Tax=Pseudomonas aeruginosa TaxID=287 RepID=UPI00053D5A66|nr:translesion error-prone DNA polymerase V autoproteolytic subunit [Pseudomonas aeruginosa]MCE7773711.1 peptidase S24 [Pseudomonas aeruginosa]MCO1696279.1 translesion error-prone DNA polymerase V autoproteolytic subunit [Pseudomonas aeruginosa]MCO1814765.1 translesion error-prone DNA polymerase V autoproteolytic subunit [Pseudomonas aeruginosa]MCT5381215.1 translesion error-prone DNA polymerase V autoproteolytic subunit [Pseudomonas aeruginosa]MDA3431482.1 translesion error-prone DNA polymera|tara:strand:- start:4525 stop:4956 length:432 start_codon:yes stop_codon:yes gene_type:complete
MSCTILGPLSSSSVCLPLYSFRVPAGFPSPAQDHIEAEISLDELLDLRAPHMYLVRISGDSMINAGMFDGDLAIVNRALEGRPGLIVIAALNGDALVKRLAKEGEQIVLRAENQAYAPRYVLEGDELLIWGVVTHSVRCHAPG